MENIWLPRNIELAVKDLPYRRDKVGMSGSEILIFDDMVLKIQERSAETDNEFKVIKWLNGRLPVPEIIEYGEAEGKVYCLMTKMPGLMACDKSYLEDFGTLIDLTVQAMEMLWSVDIADCPCCCLLDARLEAAAYNVHNNLVDMENTEPETFGEGGFASPEELLLWLCDNRPKEEPVFSHGDFCLPNIFAENGRVTGFIDLGKMGVADRWQDIALCYRSLKDNFEGKYSGGGKYGGFYPEMLFERLGIGEDPEKLRYYILLDELF